MTYILLLLALFVWPFGQLLAFSFPGEPGTVYLLDIVLGFLTISLLVSRKGRELIRSDSIFRPLAVFCLIATFSLLINFGFLIDGGFAYPLLYLLRLFVYPSVYFAVKLHGDKQLLRYIYASIGIFCVLALSQYLLFPDMRYLILVGFDDHFYRLIGSLYDPNFSGAILASVSLAAISIGNWILGLPLLLLLALTFSRASYLCFVLGLAYLLITKKKYYFLVMSALFAIIIWLIPKPFGEGVNLFRTFSFFTRFGSWQTGLELFLQRPIFGWGYNSLRNITGARFQIDNSFLFVAATTGAVGLYSFSVLLRKLIVNVTLPGKLLLGSLLVHSLFNNSFFYIWINFVFWIVAAISFKAYRQE